MRELTKSECRQLGTPWGEVQGGREVAPGIIKVHTAGHGGHVLDEAAQLAVRVAVPGSTPWTGTLRYLEEDCDWALLALARPDLFPADCVAEISLHRNSYKCIPATFWEDPLGVAFIASGEAWRASVAGHWQPMASFSMHGGSTSLRRVGDGARGVVAGTDCYYERLISPARFAELGGRIEEPALV